MNFLFHDEPIIACSTGAVTNSAISLIRISGFEDLSLFESFFSFDLKELRPRYSKFCRIVDGNEVVDSVVINFFKAPESFNGENILEIAVHGNLLNIERVIKLFTRSGRVREAYPGEFSYRALKNKKLTLSQIEGLGMLLNASSDFALREGKSLLSGDLYSKYLNLYEKYKRHRAAIELAIDFLEDVGAKRASEEINNSLKSFVEAVEGLYQRINSSYNLLAPSILLVGSPNSGKSTFFNYLLKSKRSIVSKDAGTTRDYIKETIRFQDIFFELIDSAGIRKTEKEIESEGINRTLELFKNSFFNLLLINPYDFQRSIFDEVDLEKIDCVIFTHGDLAGSAEKALRIVESIGLTKAVLTTLEGGSIGAKVLAGSIGAEDNGGSIGAEKLLSTMVVSKFKNLATDKPIILERHQKTIEKIYLDISNYSELAKRENDIAIISSELNLLGSCISELIGIVSPDDVLHDIFASFCIGK